MLNRVALSESLVVELSLKNTVEGIVVDLVIIGIF